MVRPVRATEDARLAEVVDQRKQAEREAVRLDSEREDVERKFRADPDYSARTFATVFDKISDEQAAVAAQVEQPRAREQELSFESLVTTIDADTAESLAELRRSIVEHVRSAGDLDAVRAALLTMFESFTIDGEKVVPQPRHDALLGLVEHREHPWDEAEFEPVYRRTALTTTQNKCYSSSPSQ